MKLKTAILAALALACASDAHATTYTQVIGSEQSSIYLTATDSFTAAACSDALPFMGTDITEQFGGTANSFIATLQRSPTNPATGAIWATIDSFTGAPASLTPNSYHEPGYAWWRVCVTSVSGGSATIAQSGRRG